MIVQIVAPASAAAVMLRRWIRLNGVSRTHSTSLRRSFNVTSAARSIRLDAKPWAMRASVPMEQGSTIIVPPA